MIHKRSFTPYALPRCSHAAPQRRRCSGQSALVPYSTDSCKRSCRRSAVRARGGQRRVGSCSSAPRGMRRSGGCCDGDGRRMPGRPSRDLTPEDGAALATRYTSHAGQHARFEPLRAIRPASLPLLVDAPRVWRQSMCATAGAQRGSRPSRLTVGRRIVRSEGPRGAEQPPS